MENNLSSKEIDVLVEALEAWETKDFAGRMMSDLMGAMFIDKMDEPGRLKYEEKRLLDKEMVERETKQRKETSVLLKAKLIMMKQAKSIGEALKIND